MNLEFHFGVVQLQQLRIDETLAIARDRDRMSAPAAAVAHRRDQSLQSFQDFGQLMVRMYSYRIYTSVHAYI